MTDVFLKVVNLSISASWLVLAVLAARLLLKRAPRWIFPLLWGVAALRLICPFSIESAFSLVPSAETISPEVVHYDPRPTITSGVSVIDEAVNPVISESFAAEPVMSVNPLDTFTFIMAWVWLIGMAALLVYALASAWRLRRKLATAIWLRENIYESESVSSPFVFGVVRPKIYLPMHMDEGTAAHVIAHERAHLARRDHWWKTLGFAVLALHWFNPLVWVAFSVFCRDIELACDEKVVRTMDAGRRADYSQALLSCAAPKRAVAACPLAFGEGNIKARVKNVLHYRKPAVWIVAAAVLAVVIVAVCFLTDPESVTGAETLLGVPRGKITRVSVAMEEADSGEEYRLSTPEIKDLLSLLDALDYQRLGAASAMQGCYARLYLGDAEKEYGELMLSEDGILANPIKGGGKAQLYELRSGGEVLKNYVKWCVDPNDPTVPEDLFDQIDRLLYDMPLGEYVLGEAVFNDSAWEASYAETFDEGPAGLQVGGTCWMFGPYGADSGYSYRFSEWEEITLKKSSFDWLFRSGSGEDWNGTSAAELRRENARAWRGTRTSEDINATTPLEGYLREDELTAMDQWLLLQQQDGSLYLVMGYRSGTYRYRWVVRLEKQTGPAQDIADLWNCAPQINHSAHDDRVYGIWNAGTAQTQYMQLRGFSWIDWNAPEEEDALKAAILAESAAGECENVIMIAPDTERILIFYENTDLLQVMSDGGSRWYRAYRPDDAPGGVWQTVMDWYTDAAESIESTWLLALADLDQDGVLEHIDYHRETADGGTLRVLENDTGVIWSEPLRGREGAADTAVFLCREDGREMLLEYNKLTAEYRGAPSAYSYYYVLYTFDGGEETIQENNYAGPLYLKPAANQNGDWTEEYQQFASRVNTLMDQSKLLLSYRNGALSPSDEISDWYCASPLGEGAAPVDRRTELLENADSSLDFGDALWYTADGKFWRWAGRAAEELCTLPNNDGTNDPVAAGISVEDGRVGLSYHVGGAAGHSVLALYDLSGRKTAEYSYKGNIAVSGGVAVSMSYLPTPEPNNLRISRDGGESWEPLGDASYYYGTVTESDGVRSFADAPMLIRSGSLYTTAVAGLGTPGETPVTHSVKIDLTSGETQLLD